MTIPDWLLRAMSRCFIWKPWYVAVQRAIAQRDELRELLLKADRAIKDVEVLIDASEGVMGIHLGQRFGPDSVEWHHLRGGGKYERWLRSVDEARGELNKAKRRWLF